MVSGRMLLAGLEIGQSDLVQKLKMNVSLL